jgi:arginase
MHTRPRPGADLHPAIARVVPQDEHVTNEKPTTLRLLWPQWQGAGREMVASLTPGIPLEQARHGYVTGTTVLNAILPPHDGPTASVPVTFDDDDAHRDGIDSKTAVVTQLAAALAVIAEHDADRIVTFGGECSVSVAPFAALAARYGDDLAIVWVDSHPDIGTPASQYPGYHAMAVSVLLGYGDAEIVGQLPATVAGSHVALAGLHSWTDDDYPNAAEWGLSTFSPNALRDSSQPLLDWLVSTGCHRVTIHLDVDVVDSNEEVFGLGAEPDGLTSAQVRRLIDDISRAAEVVGFTIAEYIPRQVLALQRLVAGMPLL